MAKANTHNNYKDILAENYEPKATLANPYPEHEARYMLRVFYDRTAYIELVYSHEFNSISGLDNEGKGNSFPLPSIITINDQENLIEALNKVFDVSGWDGFSEIRQIEELIDWGDEYINAMYEELGSDDEKFIMDLVEKDYSYDAIEAAYDDVADKPVFNFVCWINAAKSRNED